MAVLDVKSERMPETVGINQAALSSREDIIEVVCDICDGPVTEQGTRRSLERQGWELYSQASFCPVHADEI